jgi:Family of unknown function (DUF6788)
VKETLEALEQGKGLVSQQLAQLGDFRRGTISVNYRKCGRKNCVCAQPDHRGHGPQYLWNTTVKGKSVAENLPLGPRLEKARKELENYMKFLQLTEEFVEVSEKICKLRSAEEITNEKEIEELKKKLRRYFSKKRSKR